MSSRAFPLVALLTLVGLLMSPTAHGAADPVDPGREAANFSKQSERSSDYLTPSMLRQQAEQTVGSALGGIEEQAADPGRLFITNLCGARPYVCGGDPRLAHWKQRGYGTLRSIAFTGRNGSTLVGHVWATRVGAPRRPLVVITPGSMQATEEMYWWAAQVLAKSGYVVLTFDVQGQGRSDTFGDGEERFEGVPTQTALTTFFDHTQDALDFALSRPGRDYCPRDSRSGTSHCAKQRRRVREGAASPVNPLWRYVDPRRVGLAGHSYGGDGATWIGQQDRRVDAVVAWDNLCDPTARDGAAAACRTNGLGSPRPRIPSLGISGDYPGTPAPYREAPDPGAKSAASHRFSRAGVDSGQIVIRGGTHYEWSYIPTPAFGATLRGIDLSAWYTTAWFDRYLKEDRRAQRRLLTGRWRRDGTEASVDPLGDGNLFSYHYRSRFDLGHHDGRRIRCENLRRGCSELTRRDGRGRSYSYLAIATSPDARP